MTTVPLADDVGHLEQTLGLTPAGLAEVLGLSLPMFTELASGRRSRLGHPAAIERLARLRELAAHRDSGVVAAADLPLALAQIQAFQVSSGPQPSAPAAPVGRGDAASALGIDAASLAAARARVAATVPATPTRRWPLIEQATGRTTWVKHENHNPTGAFKVRGGLNFVGRLLAQQGSVPGLISATRGNHGQSLAFAGAAAGLPVVIVVPEGNSPDKNAAMRALGAELIVHGSDFQQAVEHSRTLAEQRGLVPVPPFHPWLVEGVATAAAELHEQANGLDAIYVPVGMGSSITAQLVVRDLLGAPCEVIGVVADRAPAYALSFAAGRVVETETADTFVDGVACRTPDPTAVALICAGASRILRVSEEQAEAAMALTYRATHNLAEPAGSLALAGLLADPEAVPGDGRRVAVVHTGGNADFEILQRVMEAHP